MAALHLPAGLVLLSSAASLQAASVATSSDAAPAVAEAPAPPAPAIVITGSRIPRRNLTAVSPVTMIKRDEVTLEGVVLTEDLINQLPQVTPDQGRFISAQSSGTATVNLRDLGAARTLVLVNGRRLLPGDPTYVAPDLNAVPSTIIQRVEVLTGGASSVYGSDAVSGVVNFILDTRIEGLRFDGQASVYQHRSRASAEVRAALTDAGASFPTGNLVDGGSQDLNAAFGRSILGGRGHVTVYGGYRTLSALTMDNRDYSACNLSTVPDFDQRFCQGSTTSGPGTFETFFDQFHLGLGRTFLPGPTFFNFSPYVYFQRPDRRYTAGGFANIELSTAFQPYVEAMYMDDRTVAQLAPSGDFQSTFSVNCDNPLLSDQQRSLVCFNGNYLGQTPVFDRHHNLVRIEGEPIQFFDPLTGATYARGFLFLARRNVEGGPRRNDRRHTNSRLVGGFKGELGRGVSYDASYVYGRVKLTEANTNDVSLTRLERSLDVVADPTTGQPVCRSFLNAGDPACVPWDVFSIGGVTPEAAAYLAIPARQVGIVEQKVANASVTIDLQQWGISSPWADDAPALNLGAEYRKDTLDYRPDAALQSGDLAGQGRPSIPFKGGTSVKELFGEARVPLLSHRLIDQLAVEGGYRHSWHSDGSTRFTTSSYKVALDLSAVRGLRLRASQQRAVRAANIQELFAPQFRDSFDHDPCAGIAPDPTEEQCARTGVAPGQYGHVLANPVGEEDFGYQSIVGGNQRLAPETAVTRAIGLVLEPRFVPGLNATVDWFNIELRGAIDQIGAQTIVDTCVATGDPLFCGRIHRDSQGTLWRTPQGYVDDTNANIGALKVRGIDVAANYSRRLGRLGAANAELLGSRLIKSVIDKGGLATPYDCGGLYGFPCSYPLPRWRHSARLTWELPGGAATLSLKWRHIGAVDLAAAKPEFGITRFVSPLETHIAAQDYFDLTALLKVKRQFVMRLGVRNLFDRSPPLVTSGNPACYNFCAGNTYPLLYDPLGRYLFAGVTVNH